MKASSRLPRTPSRLSDSVHHQLNMYALAASAAAVGLLSLTQPAEARVFYTPAHKWIPVNRNYSLDLNHDGVGDFKLGLFSSNRSSGFSHDLNVNRAKVSQSRNQIYSVVSGGVLCAAALPKGTKVGPNSPGFRSRLPAAAMFSIFSNPDCTSSRKVGPWLKVKGQAYLGVRFAIKGKVHYGWARIGNISHVKPLRALLTGYAYETIPNKPIITGRTNGPDAVQPASLGHLAQGASTIQAWR